MSFPQFRPTFDDYNKKSTAASNGTVLPLRETASTHSLRGWRRLAANRSAETINGYTRDADRTSFSTAAPPPARPQISRAASTNVLSPADDDNDNEVFPPVPYSRAAETRTTWLPTSRATTTAPGYGGRHGRRATCPAPAARQRKRLQTRPHSPPTTTRAEAGQPWLGLSDEGDEGATVEHGHRHVSLEPGGQFNCATENPTEFSTEFPTELLITSYTKKIHKMEVWTCLKTR